MFLLLGHQRTYARCTRFNGITRDVISIVYLKKCLKTHLSSSISWSTQIAFPDPVTPAQTKCGPIGI